MFDIGQTIFQSLQPLGTEGLLFCVFLLFFIDAIVFPTLPELFAVIIFMVQPTAPFALLVLATIAVAEILGTSTLYFIIKRVRIPKRIKLAADKYCSMLFVKNERIVLLNRIAPILPFMGAFAAICNWNFRKVLAYTFIGGMVKYGAILAMSSVFFAYMSTGMAETVTMALVICVIVISLTFSVVKNRKEGRPHESG
jgi:membrane protein YqaA with SNARE-associated domain